MVTPVIEEGPSPPVPIRCESQRMPIKLTQRGQGDLVALSTVVKGQRYMTLYSDSKPTFITLSAYYLSIL